MFDALRILVGIGSLLLLLVGFVLLVFGGPIAFSGLWFMVLGAVGLVAVGFERSRYRPAGGETTWSSLGAAGAHEGSVEPRFRPTDERFVDPTTRQRLRVWSDPATGERLYRLDE